MNTCRYFNEIEAINRCMQCFRFQKFNKYKYVTAIQIEYSFEYWIEINYNFVHELSPFE